jgi:hypothetical protein
MSTMTDTRPDPATAADFLSIVLSDDELVRAEFDAIVADQWPDDPPPSRGDENQRGGAWVRPDPDAGSVRAPSPARYRNAPIDRWWRQRSPPPGRRPPGLAGPN